MLLTTVQCTGQTSHRFTQPKLSVGLRLGHSAISPPGLPDHCRVPSERILKSLTALTRHLPWAGVMHDGAPQGPGVSLRRASALRCSVTRAHTASGGQMVAPACDCPPARWRKLLASVT